MRIAFIGFRHGHILSLHKLASKHAGIQIVANCEDHAPTRQDLATKGIAVTHDDYRRVLAEVPCDAVAVGDYYARRGEVLMAALQAGKHVISDKPLCTRLGELERIQALSRRSGLSVGCQLELRDRPAFRTARRLLRGGAIGEIQTVCFTGQHPLSLGSRPGWYFEEGKHGGTINDIAIHGIDALPWMTGRKLQEVAAARVWNARPDVVPGFQDGAQFLLRLDNGGGVFGDVSYLAPEKCGFPLPQYWRFTIHGTAGLIEFNIGGSDVCLIPASGAKQPTIVPPEETAELDYFDSFLHEAQRLGGPINLTTEEVLESSRQTLLIQQAADESRCHLEL